jgi:DNA polymerase III gamma/tau subunit
LVQLLDAVFIYDHKTVIETLQNLIQSGANSAQLLTDLIRISTQLVHTALGLTDLVDGTPDYHSDLQSICKKTTHAVMTQLLAKLADIEGEMRWFSYPSLLLQIRLVEFMTQQQANAATPPKQSVNPSEQIKKPAVAKQSTQPPIAEMPTESPIVATKPAPAVIATSSPVSSAKSTDQSTGKIWETVLDDIKKQNTALYALLRGSTVVSEDKTTLYIKLKQAFKFFIDKLSESHHQDTINTHLANHFTPPKQFKLYEGTAPSESSPPSDLAETVSLDSEKSSPLPASDSSDIQRINQVVKLFEGTIV